MTDNVMEAERSQSSILVTRDLVEHFQRKFDDEANARERLQRDVELKHGELSNERRTRQWLESRLDRVVHALASSEATRKYREERMSGESMKEILDLTRADVANEKRLRGKLEETVKVMERAKAVETYKRKIEEEEKAVGGLRTTLETARTELVKECETVRVLEATISDLEKPITEDIDTSNDKSFGELQGARIEFLVECRARQRLERHLIELEEAMEREQPAEKNSEEALALERIQDELSVERKLRERLEKKLKARAEEQKHEEEMKEEDNMLQTLLKCTLDKLSNERRVRRTLEERLAVLERAVEKEQAKTKFDEIFLELTQNELSEEREARLDLERKLAEKAEIEAGQYFDAKLDALDKIITTIQEQNRQDEIDEVAEGRRDRGIKDGGVASFIEALQTGTETNLTNWLNISTSHSDLSLDTMNVSVSDDRPQIAMEARPDKCFEEKPSDVEPALDEPVQLETTLCKDEHIGTWHMVDEFGQNHYEIEDEIAERVVATRETRRYETTEDLSDLHNLLGRVELELHDDTLEELTVRSKAINTEVSMEDDIIFEKHTEYDIFDAAQGKVNDTEKNIEDSRVDATLDIEPVIFDMGEIEHALKELSGLNVSTALEDGRKDFTEQNYGLYNSVAHNIEDNIFEAARDVTPTVFAMKGIPNTEETFEDLVGATASQEYKMEDFSVDNNDLCKSVGVNSMPIEDNVLYAAEDTFLATLAKKENAEQTLPEVNIPTPHEADKPVDNQLLAAKLAGNQDQALEEKLTKLGAIKKTLQFENQPELQENSDDEQPGVYRW